MKVYLIQKFTFFKNDAGYDQQVANCGETPYVFTAKYKALEYFNELLELAGKTKIDIQLFPYEQFTEYRTLAGKEYRTVTTLQEVETEH